MLLCLNGESKHVGIMETFSGTSEVLKVATYSVIRLDLSYPKSRLRSLSWHRRDVHHDVTDGK